MASGCFFIKVTLDCIGVKKTCLEKMGKSHPQFLIVYIYVNVINYRMLFENKIVLILKEKNLFNFESNLKKYPNYEICFRTNANQSEFRLIRIQNFTRTHWDRILRLSRINFQAIFNKRD